ncbi:MULTISPECIES: hypothetical protein [unclassified Clostridium]|uniref:hypothetical protein n=1 Tax=unclassified Clostridium TaxID=2614128 RepID=UPI000297360A|nr:MULTISPECIES: hypothetical protein [unclassified Clostridium]EKQ57020.1 MAG: hypothetical protein A370_01327 [Clostridium sp. Maddingley MBC34-26]
MMNKNNFWGFFFIVIGILLFMSRLLHIQLFGMDRLWPLFILIPGLSFNFAYFATRTNPGVLVPGGILTTLGLLFFFETITNWHFAGYTWPIYPFSVAIGLFQLYYFGGRKRGLLIPICILTIIPAVSFASMLFGNIFRVINTTLVVPAILILVGIALIFGKGHKNIE